MCPTPAITVFLASDHVAGADRVVQRRDVAVQTCGDPVAATGTG